jgi:hypothetical protein
MTDQLDVKKCVDDLIQRLNVPDEPPKYVLSPLQVELFKKHLGVSDEWVAAHVVVLPALGPTKQKAPMFSFETRMQLHQQELQKLRKR